MGRRQTQQRGGHSLGVQRGRAPACVSLALRQWLDVSKELCHWARESWQHG